MSKAYTDDQIQEQFLTYIHSLVEYWENEKSEPTTKGKLEGLAFSILSLIDGNTVLPSFELKSISSEEDIEYYKKQGEDYFPLISGDIAGSLHERFYEIKKTKE